MLFNVGDILNYTCTQRCTHRSALFNSYSGEGKTCIWSEIGSSTQPVNIKKHQMSYQNIFACAKMLSTFSVARRGLCEHGYIL